MTKWLESTKYINVLGLMKCVSNINIKYVTILYVISHSEAWPVWPLSMTASI
jgi:hypothetical protein